MRTVSPLQAADGLEVPSETAVYKIEQAECLWPPSSEAGPKLN